MSTQSKTNQPNTAAASSRRMSRRSFLRVLGIGTGSLAIGVVAGWPFIRREAHLAINQAFLANAPGPNMPDSPFVWIQIDPDNTTNLYLPKIEMGQGIHTTLAQIAAEDLELDWHRIKTFTAETDRGFDTFTSFTFGSASTVSLYQPIREIAATMRMMLIIVGAAKLGVSANAVTASNSRVFVTDNTERGLTYGEIVAAHQGEWVLPAETPLLKSNDAFQFIGKPMQRVDFRDKVTGRAIYGFDARTDGMLYGAVARPPRYGARLAQATAGDAESQQGVKAVVIRDNFAGVVAESRVQAYAALHALELTWSGGTTWSQQDVDDFMAIQDSGGVLTQRVGDFDEAVRDAPALIEAEYSIPLGSHGCLEPQAALADVRDDGVTIYASTQGPGQTRDFVARALNIDADQVNVFPTYVGGGFGRKLGIYAPVEAAILSQACGQPVHVGWDRSEEMGYGYHRPPARNRLRALLDDQGTIVAMQHHIASGDIIYGIGTIPAEPIVSAILGADPLAISNVKYDIPHRQVLYHRKDLPIPTGSWRGLGTMPNTFAVESFIDELAQATGTDPLQMRLRHLPNDDFGARTQVVLQAAADAANWGNEAADGHGMAVGSYGDTIVAMVADVSVTDGRIQVHHVWCTVDPGLVVNPDGARAQIEGTIVMALSSALYERHDIENGMIVAEKFDRYQLITIADVPVIDVMFIESSDTPVGGMGEAAIGIVPAAIGNALFAATGQRQRHLPFQSV